MYDPKLQMRNLDIRIGLNKQSKNIDYQPFYPTLEQRNYFVNDNLTPDKMNTLNKEDYEKKEYEIKNKFLTNLKTIIDPLLIDTVISNKYMTLTN
jgi:hypothetical protein